MELIPAGLALQMTLHFLRASESDVTDGVCYTKYFTRMSQRHSWLYNSCGSAGLTLQAALQFLRASGCDVTDEFCILQTTLQTGQWV